MKSRQVGCSDILLFSMPISLTAVNTVSKALGALYAETRS